VGEPGSGPVGGASVEGRTHHGHVVRPTGADVFDVRCLQEGVDAGKVRELPSREGGDAPVDDRVSTLEAQLESPGDLLLPLGGREVGLGCDRIPGLGAVPIVKVIT
jgi:hypothetical protein